jgi:hypothetical protein
LDVACVICTNTDQIDNVIDLVYKLRHTEHATDLSPSSEYAIYRLLLEHNDTENFFKLLNDTVRLDTTLLLTQLVFFPHSSD